MVGTGSLVLNLLSGTLLSSSPFSYNAGFSAGNVASLAQSLPSHSWEYGTAAEALLELNNPLLSVFGPTPFPVPTLQKDSVTALSYAASKITFGQNENSLANGDGAVGDPASLGVSAVMLGKTNSSFAAAAGSTVNYLLYSAPRYSNGAISQRVSAPILWADFMYMVPPFLAYYAADQSNASLLQESVNQCGYYREVLQYNASVPYSGAWHHIIGPNNNDLGIWSTGNGWAAAGMTRVLATVMRAPVAQGASWAEDAIKNLTSWIMEILDAAMASSMDGGLLRNYFDDMDPNAHGFGEISGSSLLSAVVYRMATLQPDICNNTYVTWADGIRNVLSKADASGNPHITATGIATPTVNPLAWADTTPYTAGSPEGQSFVILMYTAWRDCVVVGRCTDTSSNLTARHRKRRLHTRLLVNAHYSQS